MAYRRTFNGYTPSARETADGPWTNVRVMEGLTADDLTQIDSQALNPLDVDPTAPLTRDIITESATLPVGWYQLIFFDGTGNEDPSGVEYYGGALSPSVQQVADFIRARTVSMGVQINRFDDTTDPTADQVAGYVAQAGTDLVAEVGRAIPIAARDLFRAVTKHRAAMLIEVNSEDINESRYDRLSTDYLRLLDSLKEAVAEVEVGGDPGGVDDTFKPIALANSQGSTVSGLFLDPELD